MHIEASKAQQNWINIQATNKDKAPFDVYPFISSIPSFAMNISKASIFSFQETLSSIVAQKVLNLFSGCLSTFKNIASSVPLLNHMQKNVSLTQEKPTKLENSTKDNLPWTANFKNIKHFKDHIYDASNADLEDLLKIRTAKGYKEGDIITLTQKDHTRVSYTVHSKIAGYGLVSYALKPLNCENAEPMVIFRCTEPNLDKEEAFNSIKNDVEPQLGKTGWIGNKSAFKQLMEDVSFRRKDQKIIVSGYSLGGAHAQYFIAEHFENVSKGILYSNPSIQANVVDNFKLNIKNSSRDKPLFLQIFRNQGDLVHLAGEKHLGCECDHPNVQVQLIEIETPGKFVSFDLHKKRMFSTNEFDYIAHEYVDPKILAKKLNNHKRSFFSSLIEKLRTKLSHTIIGWLDISENFYKFFTKIRYFFRSNSSKRK